MADGAEAVARFGDRQALSAVCDSIEDSERLLRNLSGEGVSLIGCFLQRTFELAALGVELLQPACALRLLGL